MNGNTRRGRTLVFIAILCLIAIGTVGYKFNLIHLIPVYTQVTSEVDAVAADNQTAANSSRPGGVLVPSTENQSVVAVVQSKEKKAEAIQYPEIKAMVTEAVTMAGGFAGLIKDRQTVVIKPNLVTPFDYTLPNWQGKPLAPEVNGTTTDYRVTRAIVELVRKYNPTGKIYVMEGSSFSTRDCMKQLNYTSKYISSVDEFVCIEEDSGSWRDVNSANLVKVPVKDPLLKKEVYMNKRYKNADVIISVPVLKTHWTEVTSGSIKNVGIGATPATIYGGDQPGMFNRTGGIDHDKRQLDKWIHDWFMARPIEFAIIDGLQGIQNGPTPCYEMTRSTDIKQDQMNTRLILASRDCVAADTIESLIMEWNPAAVGYLGYLEKSGAGNCNVAHIRVAGKQVTEVRMDFKGTAPTGKFTALTPPKVTILKTVKEGDLLKISLTAERQTTKIEVYIGGQYIGTVVPVNPQKCTIEVKGAASGKIKNDILLKVYDQYLNCAETPVRAIN